MGRLVGARESLYNDESVYARLVSVSSGKATFETYVYYIKSNNHRPDNSMQVVSQLHHRTRRWLTPSPRLDHRPPRCLRAPTGSSHKQHRLDRCPPHRCLERQQWCHRLQRLPLLHHFLRLHQLHVHRIEDGHLLRRFRIYRLVELRGRPLLPSPSHQQCRRFASRRYGWQLRRAK